MVRGFRKRRPVRRYIAFGVLALVLGAGVGAWLALPSYVESRVRSTLSRVGGSIDSTVEVDTVETHAAREVVLRGVTVRATDAAPDEPPVLRLGEVVIEVDRMSVLSGRPRLLSVRVSEPELVVLRRPDGTDNIRELRKKVERWLSSPKAGGVPGAESIFLDIDPRVPTVDVDGGRIVIRDLSDDRSLLPAALPSEVVLKSGTLEARNRSRMLDRLDLEVVAKASLDLFETELQFNARYDRRSQRGSFAIRLARPAQIPLPGGTALSVGQAVWSGGRSVVLRDVDARTLGHVSEVAVRWRDTPTPTDDDGLAKVLARIERLELVRPVVALDQLVGLGSWARTSTKDTHATLPAAEANRKAPRRKRPRLKKDQGVAVRQGLVRLFERLGARIAVGARRARTLAERLPLPELVVKDGQLGPGEDSPKLSLRVTRTEEAVTAVAETAGDTPTVAKASVALQSGDVELQLKTSGLPMAQLEPYVPASVVLKDARLEDTDLTFRFAAATRVATVSGRLGVRGLTLQLGPIASVPLEGIAFGGKVNGSYSLSDATASLSSDGFRIGAVPVTGRLAFSDLGEAPVIQLTFDMPRVASSAVVDSLPKGLLGQLATMKTKGEISWSLDLNLDTRDMSSLQYTSDGHEYGFGVVTLGDRVNLDMLKKPFKHRVQEPGGVIEEFNTGPGSRRWVSLGGVSEWMPKVLTTTEDGSFWRHQGLAFFAIRDALIQNLERGRFYRGASTLTQQLVKNLFLIREKTVARKLQEMFLAWHMDRHLKKREILALYVNIVEFGPKVYGIRRAARYYFGKSAAELDAVECAFLASMLPNPKKYHYQFTRGEVTNAWRIGLQRTLEVMVKRNKMTKAEFEAHAPYSPVFRHRK